ncbi:MAG: SIS domain-containing protein [Defluviitaleaceae bacterium]|nr:SIS domain-containing protein [Defluviitaleaceae bacterium]
MLSLKYIEKLQALITQMAAAEGENIARIARIIAGSTMKDGLLHMFGCGHSHLLISEAFYRAGGFIPVNPIYETSAMLHEGAVKSSMVERMSGYAKHILDNYETHPGEVIIIFSNSGINSLPIEMAIEAKAKGLIVVAITSMSYKNEKSRHDSGKKLFEFADYIIDSKIPKGDGLVDLTASKVIAPGSTAVCAAIVNMLICEIGECYLATGIEPPFFISGNVEGGLEKNQSYIDQYRHRVKSL